MKFYILDDLYSSVKNIENIVESRNLGEVIGTATSSEKAVSEILSKCPDIAIVDLLMPIKDGITVVREVRDVNPDISFIMLSQVVDKDMIADAYKAGIEYFITKPNNVIEIENVIRRVIEKRQMMTMLNGIRSFINPSDQFSDTSSKESDDIIVITKKVLGYVGMLGETGTKDITNVMLMLKKNGNHYDSKSTLNDYAKSLGEDAKIVKQRIRRSIKKGLSNIAAIGIEDYYSESFETYANTLFNFDAVRAEMELQRGKSPYGGRPSIDKFFEGLELLLRK